MLREPPKKIVCEEVRSADGKLGYPLFRRPQSVDFLKGNAARFHPASNENSPGL
jgi:hypothetical protein